MLLFLDDKRVPYDVFRDTINPLYEKNDDWVIVRNYYEFINVIQRVGIPKFISFDHDLDYDHYLMENQKDINYDGLNSKTGYDAAIWLCKYCLINDLELPEYYVHSANLEGKKNIMDYLETFSKYV